ncbi:hypothetical protein CCP1ISM_20052 [Azospirillaceae bacterium]
MDCDELESELPVDSDDKVESELRLESEDIVD